MKTIFQYLKSQFLAYTKVSHAKGSHVKKTMSIENQNPKTKAENKAFLTLPTAFDFIAYFDDKELENNEEDMSHENPTVDTNNKVLCMKEENCDEMLYSSTSQQFECCIN